MVVPASHLGGTVPSGGPCTQICSDLLSCFWLGTIARRKLLLGIREAGINNHENQLFREGGDSLQMSSCQDDVESGSVTRGLAGSLGVAWPVHSARFAPCAHHRCCGA